MLAIAIKTGECMIEVKVLANKKISVKAVTTLPEEEHVIEKPDGYLFDRDDGDSILSVSERRDAVGVINYVVDITNSEGDSKPSKKIFIHHRVSDNGMTSKFIATMTGEPFYKEENNV